MTYERFEDVPVWKDAVALAVDLYAFLDKPALRRRGDLVNQIERAVLSISNNVAEGFERGTTQELLTFLYYAKGSAGEVRSALHVLARLAEGADYKSQITDYINRVAGIARQLGGWANKLQNSGARGQRYQNDQVRQRSEEKKRQDAFMEQLRDASRDAESSGQVVLPGPADLGPASWNR